VGRVHADIPEYTLQAQTARAYGLEVCSACDEDDLDATRSKPRTEVATDPARTKHCHTHGHLLVLESSTARDDCSIGHLPSYVLLLAAQR
jgi:hypothetical protein